MDVFAFREELIAEYARFSRCFTRIRTEGIARKGANSGTTNGPAIRREGRDQRESWFAGRNHKGQTV